nr:ribosomal protein S3 [Aragoa cleefii]
MARKGNPISVRLDLNRSSDSSWFSDYYYGKSVYQDLNLRSYFGSIRPPTRLTFGFRLGRCIILHFPKRTFISFFLPRPPRGLKRRRLKRREKSRPGKAKGQLWEFGKVGPIGCLHSSDGTEEERNEVRGRGSGKRVESIRREKQNEIRIWPKKKQGYGYHDRSPSIKKNLSKSLQVSGAFKHPTYAEVVNGIAFKSIRKTKFFHFFFPKNRKRKKSRSDGPTRLKRTLPAVRSSLNYSVMQYLLNKKNKIHFDPVVVLNHFVAPGVAEPSTMGGANAQERSLDKRIRSRIAFFLESSTSDKKCLAEAKKRFTHFIRQANDLRFAGTTKTTISLFPFFGATFFFPRDGVGVYNQNLLKNTRKRKKLLGKFKRKCWNLMAKDKVMELIEKFIDLGRIGELIKGIEMMIEIILRNRRIPYGYNSYLNEVQKMRSLLSNNTNTLIESVKIKSVYQSASPIAQDISFQLRTKRRSFRSILSQIVKKIPLVMKKGVTGIRICCSGRSEGAEIARTECGKYGKTSRNVFNQKIDYAPAEVSTRYGILGVKVWISYSQKRKGRAISKTYEI